VAVAAAGPSAVAGTTTTNFTVTTTVRRTCTFTTTRLTFPAYNRGTSNDVQGSTDFTIRCPGTTAADPEPVSFQFSTASGIFRLSGGGGSRLLDYELCEDAACVTPYVYNTPGSTINLTATPQTYTLYGDIPANQMPGTTGNATQRVTATLNF
jgi:spore coat protein U-like protein